jgi:hypothetical protein
MLVQTVSSVLHSCQSSWQEVPSRSLPSRLSRLRSLSLHKAVSSAAVGLVLSRRLFFQVRRLFETLLVSPLRPEASAAAGNLNLLLASSRHGFVLICPDLLEGHGTEQGALDHQTIGKVSLLCSSRSESLSAPRSLTPSLPLFSPLSLSFQSIGCFRATDRRHVSE